MPDATPHRIALTAHTTTQSEAVRSLEAHVTTPRQGILALRYCLQAEMSRIRVAFEGTVAAGRTDALWKHTCFEAFIRPDESRGYYELNFSAARQWAAYRFDAYREGMMVVDLPEPPTISVTGTAHNLELNATVALPFGYARAANESRGSARPRLALTAVIEEDSGRLCYWSARHPPGKPDFHHPDGYVFEL
jgi:hypothetical protein